ncbi:MAG: gamma-glutamylcyclotransferase [Candidatus Puniceispirillaceae bacterium]
MSSELKTTKITREALQDWRVAKMAREQYGADASVATEDQLLESRRAMVPDDADCRDLWVFGYGSLIFNPIIAHEQRLLARTHGYQRRFCLWTKIGRGSPECPGLVLSLDRGGSCVGVGFRLNPETAIAELDLLWRREMLTLAYNARWLRLHTAEGIKRGLAFVANPQRPAYAPPMPFEDTVATVATAAGFNGHCRDYLFDTLAGMHDCGIRDRAMEKLAKAVSERLASSA